MTCSSNCQRSSNTIPITYNLNPYDQGQFILYHNLYDNYVKARIHRGYQNALVNPCHQKKQKMNYH